MVAHADYDNKKKVYDVALVHYVAEANCAPPSISPSHHTA